MNFIVKFPISKKLMTGFKINFIIIIVDCLTKDITFIFFTEKADAEELAYVFLKWIVAEQSFSEKLITD